MQFTHHLVDFTFGVEFDANNHRIPTQTSQLGIEDIVGYATAVSGGCTLIGARGTYTYDDDGPTISESSFILRVVVDTDSLQDVVNLIASRIIRTFNQESVLVSGGSSLFYKRPTTECGHADCPNHTKQEDLSTARDRVQSAVSEVIDKVIARQTKGIDTPDANYTSPQ